MTEPVIFWFRRDLRLTDHPALEAAIAGGGPVLPVFISDPALRNPSGPNRLSFLADTVGWLTDATEGALVHRQGRPTDVLRQLANDVGAKAVYATDDYGPYGRARDTAVGESLAKAGIATHFRDSAYAVAPGSVVTGGGTSYKVFTPFFKAWKGHGWSAPSGTVNADWLTGVASEPFAGCAPTATDMPVAGEQAAWNRVDRFLDGPVFDYGDGRDRPGIDGTSRLSPYLKWGTIHPRQLLARLGPDPAEDVFRSELAWREFYAEVLFQRPDSARASFVPKMSSIEVDSGPSTDQRFAAWCQGQTGYPIVDAGMRQLLAEGWMHNRVRMIVASFLVKDLHLDWRRGAGWFMEHLVDGDLASNSHGWQWVAGTGTDASPYFRVFNPMTQSRKFDPEGEYLRRWLPELAHLSNKQIHQPWTDPVGAPAGYPGPIVDHAKEREESLRRYDELKVSWQ